MPVLLSAHRQQTERRSSSTFPEIAMNTATASSPAPARPWRLNNGQALWLVASLIVTFLGASSAPSPLYAVYRQAWGFSALTLTLVFAVYAFALLSALLVFGTLSDYRGRRSVILVGLMLQIGATLLFRNAQSVAWLFAARALQGFATGFATGALTAGLIDFDRERGPLINSVAPVFGMALGAVGTSALLQFAPAPTRLVFDLFLVAFGVQTIGAFFLPETVKLRPVRWAALKPAFSIPVHARRLIFAITPSHTAQWALGGFYLSLGPTLAKSITGLAAPLVGGALVATLLGCAGVAILVARRHAAHTAIAAGTALLLAGMAVTVTGMALHSTALFFAGTAIAGLGFGATFNASLRSIAPLAAPQERAGLMASFFAMGYLAFSVPNVLVGLAAGSFGLFATSIAYGIVLIAMFAIALTMILRQPAE